MQWRARRPETTAAERVCTAQEEYRRRGRRLLRFPACVWHGARQDRDGNGFFFFLIIKEQNYGEFCYTDRAKKMYTFMFRKKKKYWNRAKECNNAKLRKKNTIVVVFYIYNRFRQKKKTTTKSSSSSNIERNDKYDDDVCVFLRLRRRLVKKIKKSYKPIRVKNERREIEVFEYVTTVLNWIVLLFL